MDNNEQFLGKQFVMRGPMRITDPAHTPVRGDLADIRLAGRYFVPHYAVPQLRHVTDTGAQLLTAARSDAAIAQALSAGSAFYVIDVAGAYAWGQAEGETGPVGYIALDQLDSAQDAGTGASK